MPRMTITAIAAAVGVHKSTVSRQARAASLVGADGLVEYDDYVALRSTALDPALQTSGSGPVPAKRQSAEPSALAGERAGKIAADRRLAELELARKLSQVVEVAGVDRAQEDMARQLRDRILRVPRAIAGELALLPDEAAIAAHLTMALERAIAEQRDALRGAA